MEELLSKVTFCGKVVNHSGSANVHKSTGYRRLHYRGSDFYVHRLVALKYLGEPNGLHVNHKDGNKLNNALYNLEYVTRAGNAEHAHKTGLINAKGEGNGRAILTKEDVLSIRSNLKPNIKELAKEFKVSGSTIRNVLNRDTWKDV